MYSILYANIRTPYLSNVFNPRYIVDFYEYLKTLTETIHINDKYDRC